jgi:hypothetical protein
VAIIEQSVRYDAPAARLNVATTRTSASTTRRSARRRACSGIPAHGHVSSALRNSRLRCSSAIAVVGKHSSGCGAQLNVARAPCTSRRGFAMRARRPAHEAPALSPPIVPAVVHTSWRRRRSMAGGAPAEPSLSRRSAPRSPLPVALGTCQCVRAGTAVERAKAADIGVTKRPKTSPLYQSSHQTAA